MLLQGCQFSLGEVGTFDLWTSFALRSPFRLHTARSTWFVEVVIAWNKYLHTLHQSEKGRVLTVNSLLLLWWRSSKYSIGVFCSCVPGNLKALQALMLKFPFDGHFYHYITLIGCRVQCFSICWWYLHKNGENNEDKCEKTTFCTSLKAEEIFIQNKWTKMIISCIKSGLFIFQTPESTFSSFNSTDCWRLLWSDSSYSEENFSWSKTNVKRQQPPLLTLI